MDRPTGCEAPGLTTADLAYLTQAEHEVYDALRHNRYGGGVRLEQERISYDRVREVAASSMKE